MEIAEAIARFFTQISLIPQIDADGLALLIDAREGKQKKSAPISVNFAQSAKSASKNRPNRQHNEWKGITAAQT